MSSSCLNQRGVVETVIGHLKHHYQIWHTRHRSVLNAITHLVSALAAYTIEPLKISAIKRLELMAWKPKIGFFFMNFKQLIQDKISE